MKNLRLYQKNIVTKLHKIFNLPEKKAFLQMPTGTGKTFTALMFSQELAKKKNLSSVIWIVHQTNLYIQSATDFLSDFKAQGGTLDVEINSEGDVELNLNEKYITGELNGIKYVFMTWQRLSRLVESNKIKKNQYDLLIVDEAHYGSSENQYNEHKSFKKIFNSKLFEYHLYVSATLWNLNPQVYPKLVCPVKKRAYSKYLAVYTTEQAANDDVINSVDFVCITSADTLKLKKLNEEDETELTANETKKLAEKTTKLKVDINHQKSKDAVYKAVVRQVLLAYLNTEDPKKTGNLPPTIVFCNGVEREDVRNIKSVKQAFKNAFDYYYGEKFNTGKGFINAVSGQDKDSYQILKSFTEGKFKILLVANMAQEGFNYPKLEVAIDLNPNYNNTARWNQKIGRVTRRLDNKPASRYYYADHIRNYIKASGFSQEIKTDSQALNEMIQSTNPDLTMEEKTLAIEGLANTLTHTKNSQEAETDTIVNTVNTSVKDVKVFKDKAENISNLKPKNQSKIVATRNSYIICSAMRQDTKTFDRKVSYKDIIKMSSDRVPWEYIFKNWSEKKVEKMILEQKKTGKKIAEIWEKYND